MDSSGGCGSSSTMLSGSSKITGVTASVWVTRIEEVGSADASGSKLDAVPTASTWSSEATSLGLCVLLRLLLSTISVDDAGGGSRCASGRTVAGSGASTAWSGTVTVALLRFSARLACLASHSFLAVSISSSLSCSAVSGVSNPARKSAVSDQKSPLMVAGRNSPGTRSAGSAKVMATRTRSEAIRFESIEMSYSRWGERRRMTGGGGQSGREGGGE